MAKSWESYYDHKNTRNLQKAKFAQFYCFCGKIFFISNESLYSNEILDFLLGSDER